MEHPITEPGSNPYSPPYVHDEASAAIVSSQLAAPQRGPALLIASGALLGLLAGLLLVMLRLPFGFLGFMPGAVIGGLYYRLASAPLPIDPGARRRRYTYAVVALCTLPVLAGALFGLRAQGMTMTIGALLIGAAFAMGILISGDRRPNRAG